MATEKPAKPRGAKAATDEVWTAEEKAAMREHARDVKAQARRAARGGKPDGEADLLAKIAEMPDADRVMAERIHAIVTATAPGLSPKTWYGMPAYANAQGKVVCFFQAAAKFKARYATFGFDQEAHLDDGTMWPTSWALTKLTPAAEKQIAELVKKAAG